MMKMKNEIVERLLAHVAALPNGTEFSTFEAVIAVYGKDCYDNGSFFIEGKVIDDIDLMQIDYAVRENAKKYGVRLDSSEYEGMALGLPFHIRFVIRHRKKK